MSIKKICLMSVLLSTGAVANEGFYSVELISETSTETSEKFERKVLYFDSMQDLALSVGLQKTADKKVCTEHGCIEYFSPDIAPSRHITFTLCEELLGEMYTHRLHFQRMTPSDPHYNPSLNGFRLHRFSIEPSKRDECPRLLY